LSVKDGRDDEIYFNRFERMANEEYWKIIYFLEKYDIVSEKWRTPVLYAERSLKINKLKLSILSAITSLGFATSSAGLLLNVPLFLPVGLPILCSGLHFLYLLLNRKGVGLYEEKENKITVYFDEINRITREIFWFSKVVSRPTYEMRLREILCKTIAHEISHTIVGEDETKACACEKLILAGMSLEVLYNGDALLKMAEDEIRTYNESRLYKKLGGFLFKIGPKYSYFPYLVGRIYGNILSSKMLENLELDIEELKSMIELVKRSEPFEIYKRVNEYMRQIRQ